MKCPTCRRTAAEGVLQCPRCGTELELLAQLCAKHDQLIRRGKLALKERDTGSACRFFEHALQIRHDSAEARSGMAVADLLSGRFEQALRRHRGIRRDK